MIPQQTLEIIQKEAKNQAFVIEIIPSSWGQPMQEIRHQDSNMEESFIACAKRGYELAMEDRWIEVGKPIPGPMDDYWILVMYEDGNFASYMTDKDDYGFDVNVTHWKYIEPPKQKI